MIQSDKYSDQRVVRVEQSEMRSDVFEIPEEWLITVKDEDKVNSGGDTASLGEATITTQNSGRVRIEDRKVIVSYEIKETLEEDIPPTSRLLIKDGDHVEAGEPLTEGSLNPHTVFTDQRTRCLPKYLLTEIQMVYRAQGQNINDKHFEVIIRKMLGKVQVTRPGDSKYLPMDPVDRLEIRHRMKMNWWLKVNNRRNSAKFFWVLPRHP